jgi:holliday junction DNA helicase RuvA
MIAYLEGKVLSVSDDRLTLVVNGIGYDILIPAYAINELAEMAGSADGLGLYILYNQTERQVKPVLVGFKNEVEKQFFELFISVEDIGPLAAIKALTKPVGEIARDIEAKDTRSLRQLKGIGERKAEKIVATLKGKVGKFALIQPSREVPERTDDFRKEVESVLVLQLGYKAPKARTMIEEALKRDPTIATSEGLFEEVYRGQKL